MSKKSFDYFLQWKFIAGSVLVGILTFSILHFYNTPKNHPDSTGGPINRAEQTEEVDIASLLARVTILEKSAGDRTNPTFTISRLPKGIKYTDLIGSTIIDSFGNLYPAPGVTASLGTPDNRYTGIYAKNFSVDGNGNLTAQDMTVNGNLNVSHLNSDLIPTDINKSLGNSTDYFKNLYVSNIYYSGSVSDATFLGGIAANGGSITTTGTGFSLINTNATTVNFAGAATNLSIGASTGTTTINNSTISFPNATTISAPNAVATFGSITAGSVAYNSLSLADGTAAIPALNFTNNTNAGLYRLGSNAIGLITNGSAISGLTINNGNVGIGVTTPHNTLDVQSITQPQFRVAYDGSNYATLSVSSSGNLTITPSSATTTIKGTSSAAGVPVLKVQALPGTSSNQLLHLSTADNSVNVFTVDSNANVFMNSSGTAPILWMQSSGPSPYIWRFVGDSEFRFEKRNSSSDTNSFQEFWRASNCSNFANCRFYINQPSNVNGSLSVGGTYLTSDPVLVLSSGPLGSTSTGNLISAFTNDNATTLALGLNATGTFLTLGASNPTITTSGTNNLGITANKISMGPSSNRFFNLMPTSRAVVGGTVASGQFTVSGNIGNIGTGTTAPTTVDIGANMLTNGGFETWSGGKPVGWNNSTFCQGPFIQSTTEAQDGFFALGINSDTPNCSSYDRGSTIGSPDDTGVYQALPTLKAGRKYVITYVGRIDNPGGSASVAIIQGTSSPFGAPLAESLMTGGGSDTMAVRTFTYTPVSDVTGASLRIIINSGSFNTFVDSITMGSGVETGINISSGWDTDIKFSSLKPILSIANTGSLNFTDGTNPLLTITDAGTVGNIGIGTSLPSQRLQVNLGSSASVITSTGNIGIGTTTPINKLSVMGGGVFGADYAGITAPLNSLLVEGNIGIGATTSSNKLDVWGSANITQNLTIGGTLTTASLSFSNQILAIDGTKAAPGIAFANDTDTGLWRVGNNLLALTTNGPAALQVGETINGLSVNPNGNVGIGTTNPVSTLQVASGQILVPNGSASAPAYSFTNSTTSGLWSSLTNTLSLTTNNSATRGITILDNGNVGLGTTSPAFPLSLGVLTQTFGIQTQTTLNSNGGALTTTAGIGNGTGNGGALTLTSGSAGPTSNLSSGAITISTPLGINNSSGAGGASGAITIKTNNAGADTIGVGAGAGAILIQTGNGGQSGSGTGGAGGAISIIAGNGAQSGGSFADGAGGSIIITAGSGSTLGGGSPSGLGGSITLNTGAASPGGGGGVRGGNFSVTTGTGGGGDTNAVSGSLSLTSGSATGANSGSLSLTSGPTITSGTTGVILLTTGNSAAASGNVILRTGTSPSTVGSVLFQSGTILDGGFNSSGNLGLGTTNASQKFQVNLGASATVITSTGNVGIGATTANANLFINGGAAIGSSFNLAAPTNGLIVQGSVGIGTSAPSGLLDISGSSNSTLLTQFVGARALSVINTDTTNNNASGFDFRTKDLGGTLTTGAKIMGVYTSHSIGQVSGDLAFLTRNLGTISETMRITGIGNVGIGVTSPVNRLDIAGAEAIGVGYAGTYAAPTNGLIIQGNVGIGTSAPTAGYALDVNGKVRAASGFNGNCLNTGAFSNNGNCNQDIAELYNSSQNVESGDILSIDPAVEKSVRKTSAAYDQKIMGVVSTSPGLILGLNGSDVILGGESSTYPQTAEAKRKPAVALSGKVPVKVSNENGPIKIGDFLTSSSTPGVAMKATKPGQVIGKALEGFNGNNGKITVYLSISYADPNNFLASLSFDDNGNLVIPDLVAGSIRIKQDIIPQNIPLALTDDYNVADKITSLEDKLNTDDSRFKNLENTISDFKSRMVSYESTSSATSSANLSHNSVFSIQDSLQLTPPDVLLATGSASLATLTVGSDATISGKLIAYNLNISNSFKSLGETSLGKTTIAGDVDVDGTLSIENGSTINVAGTLYLQNSPLAEKLDLFNGAITVDKTGILVAQAISTNKLSVSAVRGLDTDSDPTIGKATISAGQTSDTINNNQVTDTSNIFVTPRSPTGGQALFVSSITSGQNFTVALDHAINQDIKFDWWIVETK